MESKSNKQFIIQEYDKFKQSTITKSLPVHPSRFLDFSIDLYSVELSDKEYKYYSNDIFRTFYTSVRQIKKGENELLTIYIEYRSTDWMFLRNGQLQFLVDNDSILIDATHLNSDSGKVFLGSKDIGVKETVCYIITPSQLEQIGSSKNFSIRISGSKGYLDIPQTNAYRFKIICQQFYNNVYDENKFLNSIKLSNIHNKKNDKNKSNRKIIWGILLILSGFYFFNDLFILGIILCSVGGWLIYKRLNFVD
jgi:hypothetical protein